MHEVGVAQSILDIVVETANANDAKTVNKVNLRIGKLAGIETESLTFAFDALKDTTIAKDAVLTIERVPITGRCTECGHEAEYDSYFFQCAKCNSYKVELLTGEEMQITDIEVD